MDKETLSNYGWITIVTLVLAVMLAFATPFGNYVKNATNSLLKGYKEANEMGLGEENQKKARNEWENRLEGRESAPCGINGHYIGDDKGEHGVLSTCSYGHKYTCQCDGWIVPSDGTYTMATAVNGKSVYNAGEKLPCNYAAKKSDTYEDADYLYTYGVSRNNLWCLVVKDKTKQTYAPIATNITKNKEICLYETFKDCKNLTVSPVVPNGVTEMIRTYENCSSLTTMPTIPNTVTYTNYTFTNCQALVNTTTLPNSFANMSGMFYNCSALKTAPIIPKNVKMLYQTFLGCSSLTVAPEIPNGVTDMLGTFCYCISLTTASIIPSSVTDMKETFRGCTSLIDTVTINASPSSYDMSFLGTTKPITLTGTSSKLSELAATAKNGNVIVK